MDLEGMDTEAEILAEAAGINVPAAERALKWMEGRSQQHNDRDLSDTLLRFLALICPSRSQNLFTTGLRCTALRWLIRDEGEPLTKIASECGVSKQIFDHHVRQLEDLTGIHSSAQKSPHTIKIYREASIKSWARTADRVKRRNAQRNRAAVADCYAEAGLAEEPAEENLTLND
jgi:hypothetical protein